MKKKISKIISGGLTACLMFTAVPAEFIHAENVILEEQLQAFGTASGLEAGGLQDNEPWELDLSQLPEGEKKSPAAGYGEDGTENKLPMEAGARGASADITDSGDCSGENGSVVWEYQDGRLTITGTGQMQDWPSGAPWYGYRYDITSVEVGEGVTNIGEAAFYGCYFLESVLLPDTLESIGKGAFAGCSALKELMLPDKVAKIGQYAFQACEFTACKLPSSLEELDISAFFNCRYIESISIAASNQVYQTQDGVLFSKDGGTLLYCPANKTTGTYAVPSGVSEIGDMAFIQGQMSDVAISQNVKTIGASAFQQSNITSLVIPESVRKVGDFMCYNCGNLKTVTIKPGLAALSYEMFQKCYALESVDLGKVTDLNKMAFSYCSSLKEVEIPNGTKAIMNGSFGECTALEKVVLPSTVKEIAYQAFLNCSSLTDISFPEGLKAIYRYAFYGCTGLKSVNLPSTIEEIGENAFPSTTKLNNIPESLTQQEDGSYKMTVQVKIKGKEIYSEAFSVLKKANSERKKAGKGSLKMDQELLEAAMKRALETSLYWSHTRPNGSDCFTASELIAGENIAVGSYSASAVMSQWMNSAGHKANILDENYTTIGVGCVEVDGVRYWVQCFGTEGNTAAQPDAYQDKDKARTISVSPDKEYYRPSVRVNGSKVEAGQTLKVSVTWYNEFAAIQIPASSLKYSSSNESVCTVSKGTIKGVGNGTAEVKIWFPGYEKGAVTKKVTVSRGVQIDTCTVKFNKNGGGKLSKGSLKVTKGAKIGKLPTVQRKGYIFKGWYTKKSKGTKVTEKTIIKKSQTLYGQWSKVKKPGGAQVTSLKEKSGVMEVAYKKVKGADGYEISYASSKKFTDKATKKSYTKALKMNIRNLKKGKTYYVRVRAYKTDSAKAKIYGTYSKVKRIKM